jgi:NADH dehydrogenase
MTVDLRSRVVIVGAGFGGLYAARALAKQPVDVLVIDRNNFHTFTPLLYQVATCGLEPEEIAYPIRGIFSDIENLHFMLGEVEAFDLEARTVMVCANGETTRREPYDYLIIAGGSVTNTFGNKAVDRYGFGLKDLREAVTLRNHLLRMFERAAWAGDSAEQEALTTMVVVGGGPTGLETAGALYELYTNVLRREYDFLKRFEPRVYLVEAMDRLLLPFPERLQQAALEQVRDMGIEVILNNPVDTVGEDHVRLKDGREIRTHTLVWGAGVKASPLAEMLGVELARGGRVPVRPTMQMTDYDNVYVVGDMAYLEDDKGHAYPMLIPVAKQQGILAAKNLVRQLRGEAEQPFRYVDRGIMATIGRSRAVAWIFNRIALRGYLAWISWLGLHLITLMGFRNRFNVLVNWTVNYFTYDRSVRIILDRAQPGTRLQHESGMDAPDGNVEANAQPQGMWCGRQNG